MTFTNATGTAAVAVSVPPKSGQPHAFVFNAGMQAAYLGGAGVSAATGLALAPNGRVDLSNASGTIYAIAGGNQAVPYGTANAATAVAGSVITVASGGTAFTAGMTIVVEPGTPRQEVTSVASSNAGTVNTSPAMTYAHGSATVFSQYSPLVTTLQVTGGAT